MEVFWFLSSLERREILEEKYYPGASRNAIINNSIVLLV